MVQDKATPTARRSGRTRKKNTKWEQDDKIGQRTKNTKTRRGRGGGRKKKKNKNEKIDEDVDNSTAADETEEEKLKPKKKKRKYTRRKKSSVIPRVTTTSSTGRIRKPSTKYVTYESSNDIHIPEQHQRSKQTRRYKDEIVGGVDTESSDSDEDAYYNYAKRKKRAYRKRRAKDDRERIIYHDAPRWVKILASIGVLPAKHGHLIKMIIEHAIESVSDDNQTVIDALKLSISPRVYHPKNASTCKRMVLHIVAQFGGVRSSVHNHIFFHFSSSINNSLYRFDRTGTRSGRTRHGCCTEGVEM